MKHAIILFAYLLSVHPGFARNNETTFESLFFIYVDNSKLNINDGLTSAQIKRLSALNDSLAEIKNDLYFFYSSNGNNPFVSTDAVKSSEHVKRLYMAQNSFPDVNADLERIRRELFGEPFKIEKQVSLHFFLTDNMCTSNNYETSKFFCSLAREIAMMSEFSGTISVTIYYSNQTNKIVTETLEKNMCFYNSKGEIKPKISFDLVKLQ